MLQPHPLPALTEKIDQALTEQEAAELPRGHLGMSQIGNEDARELWYQFRLSLPDEFSGRTLRIFQLGHALEKTVVDLLKQGGMEVWEQDSKTGRQWRVRHLGGHFAGSSDGIIRGVPGFEKIPHLLEIKSAKASKFREFEAKGVKQANLVYWCQMQAYMAPDCLDLRVALFVVYCKDNSALYVERVERESGVFAELHKKAAGIIASDSPPKSTYPNRSWYRCKWKSDYWNDIYWGSRLPLPNCRNCRFSAPITQGSGARWHCRKLGDNLPLEAQVTGCERHNYLPALMPAKLVKFHDMHCATEYTSRGKNPVRFFNAPAAGVRNVYSSWELEQLSKGPLGPALLNAGNIREQFDGRVVHYETRGAEEGAQN